MRSTGASPAPQENTSHRRLLRAALIASAIAAATIAAFATAGSTPVFQENGPAEAAQLTLWIGAALFAFVLAFPQPRASDKAAMIIVAAAAAAAAAREMDAHILLNPETIGKFGVRYRIDWWLDGNVVIIRKLAWAAIAIIGVAALSAATIAAHFHPILALKRKNRALIYFAAAGTAIVIGFAFDDLLRGRIPLATAQAVEESVEIFAPIFYLAAANHLAVSALAGGRAALHAQATDTLKPCQPKPTSSPSHR